MPETRAGAVAAARRRRPSCSWSFTNYRRSGRPRLSEGRPAHGRRADGWMMEGMRTRPVLVYDGDCGFCTTMARFAERRVRPRCDLVPWQFADLGALGVTAERAQYEALWVTPAGAVYGGAEAVAKALLSAGRAWPLLGSALMLPGLRWAAHRCYRLVADNRHRLPGGTAACAVPSGGGAPGQGRSPSN